MDKAAISWSAGKDCCLALLRAREAGLDVATFVTMCEEDGTSKSHALAPDLIAAQVQRFGAEWSAVRVPQGRYEEIFARTLAEEILRRGIRAVVVGVDTARLHEAYCGVEYTYEFLRSLPPGVCPCGEDGEFHTFVHAAPGMSTPVAVSRGDRRVVRSAPPLSETVLAFQELRLAEALRSA